MFNSKVRLTIISCFSITSNLVTSIYELRAEIGGKGRLCGYLCERFYHQLWNSHKRWTTFDISVIAYMINREWFQTMEVSCPIIQDDNTFKFTNGNHKIIFVKQLNVNAIYENLFDVLSKN